MLIGMVADLVKTTFGSGKIPTAFTVEKFKDAGNVKEFNEVTKPAALAQIGKFDKWLLPAGDRFTGSGQTVSALPETLSHVRAHALSLTTLLSSPPYSLLLPPWISRVETHSLAKSSFGASFT